MWQCSLPDCKRKFTCWVICINICRATANLYTVQCVCTGPIASLGSKCIWQNTVNWKRSQRLAIGQDNQQAHCLQNRYTTLFSQGKWELPKWKKNQRSEAEACTTVCCTNAKQHEKAHLKNPLHPHKLVTTQKHYVILFYTLTRLVFSDDFRTNYT